MTPTPEPLKNTVGKALGRIPSGLFVLTVSHNGQAMAMLASWVQQVAFAPPAVCVAVSKDRPHGKWITDSGRFALSVLGEGDTDLLRKYARPPAPGQDPFEGVDTLRSDAGLPVLARAVAWLDARLLQVTDFGADHNLYVAEVTSGAQLKQAPSFTHLRGNGFHY